MSEIDPITLAVLAGRMEQIADEMDATLFRAAFNPIIAEGHDVLGIDCLTDFPQLSPAWSYVNCRRVR